MPPFLDLTSGSRVMAWGRPCLETKIINLVSEEGVSSKSDKGGKSPPLVLSMGGVNGDGGGH